MSDSAALHEPIKAIHAAGRFVKMAFTFLDKILIIQVEKKSFFKLINPMI